MDNSQQKKITLYVEENLLDRAREETGEGITTTVRRALELLAASSSYEKLRKMRGAATPNLDLKELRRDRKW